MQRSYVSSWRLNLRSPFAVLGVALAAAVGCGGGNKASTSAADKAATTAAAPLTLTIGGYTTPREAYGAILPVFHESWAKPRAQELTFKESYLGSGAQARAIAREQACGSRCRGSALRQSPRRQLRALRASSPRPPALTTRS